MGQRWRVLRGILSAGLAFGALARADGPTVLPAIRVTPRQADATLDPETGLLIPAIFVRPPGARRICPSELLLDASMGIYVSAPVSRTTRHTTLPVMYISAGAHLDPSTGLMVPSFGHEPSGTRPSSPPIAGHCPAGTPFVLDASTGLLIPCGLTLKPFVRERSISSLSVWKRPSRVAFASIACGALAVFAAHARAGTVDWPTDLAGRVGNGATQSSRSGWNEELLDGNTIGESLVRRS